MSSSSIGGRSAELDDHLPELRLVGPETSGLGVQRRFVVGFSQKTLNGEEHGSHIIRGRPFILEDVKADVPRRVDVGVEARRQELQFRRFEWVLVCEDQ